MFLSFVTFVIIVIENIYIYNLQFKVVPSHLTITYQELRPYLPFLLLCLQSLAQGQVQKYFIIFIERIKVEGPE